MPTSLPPSVREHFGEAVAEDFVRWLDETFQQRTVQRDEYREVLSRLDVLEERFDQLEQRMDERFEQVDQRFEQVDQRFEQVNERFGQMSDRLDTMDDKLDRMSDRILSMTRWLIGLLALFGTLVTALLAVAQFTGG
jgi:tetrahydromethanopterin S-methyltransferase subunit G